MDFKQHLMQFIHNICKIFNTLIKIISQLSAEILVIIGLFFIVFATFKINTLAGYYCMGGVLLSIGLLLAKAR